MMKKSRMPLAILLPVLAGLFVAVWGGGFGVIFMLLDHTSLGEWAVVMLGLVLVIGVPSVAALVAFALDKPAKEHNV